MKLWVSSQAKGCPKHCTSFDEALAISDKVDPNTERGSKVTRDAMASVRSYSDILKKEPPPPPDVIGFLL
jgi:hypothetical protein